MASDILVAAAGQKTPCEVDPTEVYRLEGDTNTPVKLRIANGGAGESHLIEALAKEFMKCYRDKNPNSDKFAVAWIKSDTTASFNHLADHTADLSITYNEKAENIAIKQRFADATPYVYAWRDHFMLVGPKKPDPNRDGSNKDSLNNPNKDGPNKDGLNKDGPKKGDPKKGDPKPTIEDVFSQLFIDATKPDSTIRFLSRFDKSATNIKESAFWVAIGQTPWSYPFSFFYHVSPQFPKEALATAAALQEYTLTDRGTWWLSSDEVRNKLQIYAGSAEGKDEGQDPMLLNPAHVLVAKKCANHDMAVDFATWLEKEGQTVVGTFEQNGHILYTEAPDKKVKTML